ncbi:hypothetical protein ACI77O_13640 [Pseudomonas tritici]|uniref:hypothetical protein n=1 Tax=Pseudomonas tritici TaxID=2745518 RepID=UPI00387AB276
MTTTTKSPADRFGLNAQGKVLLSAIAGAAIGSCATLHVYYTLLGGADQVQKVAQIELTAERTRQVAEESLATVKQISDAMNRFTNGQTAYAPQPSGTVLSPKPTQRELDEAITGMFEDVADIEPTEAMIASDSTAKAVYVAPTKPQVVPASVQESAPAKAGAADAKSGVGAAGASDEAGK